MKKKDDYVDIGDIVHGKLLEGQSQYVSRYLLKDFPGYPFLGEGLRFEGESRDYHSWRIHKDDVETFVKRVKEHRGY